MMQQNNYPIELLLLCGTLLSSIYFTLTNMIQSRDVLLSFLVVQMRKEKYANLKNENEECLVFQVYMNASADLLL